VSAVCPLQPITPVSAVRRLTASDLPRALALQHEVSASLPDGFLRGKTERELHDYLCGLAGVADGVSGGGALQAMGLLRLPSPGHCNVGAAFPHVRKSDWPLHSAFLEHALVAPAARGRGLQRALIDARIAAARRAGMRWLCAGVQLANTASWRNLLCAGLVIVDGRFSQGQALLALLMRLDEPGIETHAAHQGWVFAGDAAGHEKALRAGYLGVRAAMGGTVLYQLEVVEEDAAGTRVEVAGFNAPFVSGPSYQPSLPGSPLNGPASSGVIQPP
jgi:GNAT superfamily N-acetyltransferase